MKHRGLFAILVFLLGANLRMMMTTIPPLLTTIQQQLHLSSSLGGALMTIPLLCFGIFSTMAGKLGKVYGSRLVMLVALILMTIGDILRVYSTWTMLLGTLIVGLTITVLNVLLPLFLMEYAYDNVRRYTGIYFVSMNVWAAVGSAVVVPIANWLGWQLAIQIFAVISLLTAFMLKTSVPAEQVKDRSQDEEQLSLTSVWRQGRIWLLAIFSGLQSFVFYAMLTWLPAILISKGFSASEAGLMLGIFQIAGIPAAYLVPIMSERKAIRTPLIGAIAGGYLVGLLILLTVKQNWLLVLLGSIVIGLAVAAAFTYSISLITLTARNNAETADISGMTQTVGYLVAAVSPIIIGMLHTQTSWDVVLWTLLVIAMIVVYLGLRVNRNLN